MYIQITVTGYIALLKFTENPGLDAKK